MFKEQFCKMLCRSIQGRDGCVCEPGNWCASFDIKIYELAPMLNITPDQMEALAEGRATVRMKPVRK